MRSLAVILADATPVDFVCDADSILRSAVAVSGDLFIKVKGAPIPASFVMLEGDFIYITAASPYQNSFYKMYQNITYEFSSPGGSAIVYMNFEQLPTTP